MNITVAVVSAVAVGKQMNDTQDDFSGFWHWFNGGYNFPTKKQIEDAKGFEPEKQEEPKKLGFFSWFMSGGFNIPNEKKIKKAPSVVIEPKPPTGFWAWISGGYNVPKLKNSSAKPNKKGI